MFGCDQKKVPIVGITSPLDPIPYGTATTFSWITEGDVDYVTIDGLGVENSGSYTTQILYTNRDFTLVAHGPYGTTTKVITIIIGEPIIITSFAGSNGIITPLGAVKVAKGDEKIFRIAAYNGYFVDSLIIDGLGTKIPSATADISYKFSSISADHTIRTTFRKKESYKITSSASANGVISPLGEISVTEGQTKTFQTTANELCSLQKYVVDGVDVNPASSYTFSEINASHTIDAVFKKELEWYLLKITWVMDSMYIDDRIYYVPGSEILNFSSDGTYTRFWSNQTYHREWSLDKTTTPPTLKNAAGLCAINVLNEQKMVITTPDKVIEVYHGVPK